MDYLQICKELATVPLTKLYQLHAANSVAFITGGTWVSGALVAS